jgi:hypothetical protein
MKYLSVEERIAEELSGPWHEIAAELQMTPDEYKSLLTKLFQAEDDAGVQMTWGNIDYSPHVTTYTLMYNDADLNATFVMPELPTGWAYRFTHGDVKRQRDRGKYTGHYSGEMKEGKFTVSLSSPGLGHGGFNRAFFDIYQIVHKEVLQCLANRLH